MKLLIQIPCLNEAETLPIALKALPRSIPGVDQIEVLVVDDGSTDGTGQVALDHGVDHVVRHPKNRGLAAAFTTGLQACLERGADVIVNTDADNQYCADDIPALIEPILKHRADMVVGARPIADIGDFSAVKKLLQRLGSRIMRRVTGVPVDDAPSGFRAFSANTAARFNVFNAYTYTLETLIQAGQAGMAVESVPVRVNPMQRESRLVRNIWNYVFRSMVTIFRIAIIYHPLRLFVPLALLMIAAGTLLGLRFVVALVQGGGQGMVQSLILSSVLLLGGIQVGLFGILSDLISSNRKVLQDVQFHIRRGAFGARHRDAGDSRDRPRGA